MLAVAQCFESGETVTFEYTLAELHYYEARITPQDKEIAAIIVRDVTERVNAERKLQEAKASLETKVQARTAELEDSNADLEQFAYAASHDLREPLHKITAFGSRLDELYGSQLDERGREYLGVMRSGAHRMLALVDDLLEYARLGHPKGDQVEVDLNAVLDDVLEALSESIQEAEAEVNIGDLPLVRGNPLQMFTLFQNLVSNSVKFCHSERPAVIHVMPGPDHLGFHVVTVQDNGIGFDSSFKERIFQMFERLHNRFEYPGTGIGLAMCKRIMMSHKGWIEAKGVPGEGACFNLGFPQGGTHVA